MYIRIVEITAPTKLQLNIFLDYLKVTHFPKNLEQGQMNAKVFKVNEVSAFVIAEFEAFAKTTLKVRSFEGPLEYLLD